MSAFQREQQQAKARGKGSASKAATIHILIATKTSLASIRPGL
jgi:hypothetical protein